MKTMNSKTVVDYPWPREGNTALRATKRGRCSFSAQSQFTDRCTRLLLGKLCLQILKTPWQAIDAWSSDATLVNEFCNFGKDLTLALQFEAVHVLLNMNAQLKEPIFMN